MGVSQWLHGTHLPGGVTPEQFIFKISFHTPHFSFPVLKYMDINYFGGKSCQISISCKQVTRKYEILLQYETFLPKVPKLSFVFVSFQICITAVIHMRKQCHINAVANTKIWKEVVQSRQVSLLSILKIISVHSFRNAAASLLIQGM